MSSWEKTLPKRGKVKRSDKSALAQAEKSYTPQEPKKLTHITTSRLKGPTGRGRKPPSRKPMVERTTKLTVEAPTEDMSLVANRKIETRPEVDEKTKEIKEIETQRKKSLIGKMEGKGLIRVFLDNNGILFKTVAIKEDTTVYDLAGFMSRKIFEDTTGYGIWEVKDKLDVELIDPREIVVEIMDSWKENQLYKFVYKKAHGEKAKLYFKTLPTATSRASTNSPLGKAPLPAIQKRESQPVTQTRSVEEKKEEKKSDDKPAPVSPTPTTEEEEEEEEAQEEPASSSAPTSARPSSGGRGGINSTARGSPRGSPRGAPRGAPRARGARAGSPGRGGPSRGGAAPRAAPRGGRVLRGGPVRGKLAPGRPASSPSDPPMSSNRVPPASLSEGDPTQPNSPPDHPAQKEPAPEIHEEVLPPSVLPVEPVEEPKTDPEPKESNKEPKESSKHITEWTIEEVADWISELGFESVRSVFVDNYINGAELVELTNEELKEDLGVAALGARKAILRHIQQLNT